MARASAKTTESAARRGEPRGRRGSAGTNGSESRTKLVRTRIDLPESARLQVVPLLNQQMADTFDLMSQCKQAHWNLKGPGFMELHEFYDELAELLTAQVDELAERITALGGVATGTVRMAAAASRLPEFPGEAVGDMESVELLADRFAILAKSTREAIDAAEKAEDAGTADLFTEKVQELDKNLWFLEAHLQRG